MTYKNCSLVQLAHAATVASLDDLRHQATEINAENLASTIADLIEAMSDEEKISHAKARLHERLTEVGEVEWFENFVHPYAKLWDEILLSNWSAKLKNLRNEPVIIIE